jgi:hypothetical protein
MVGLTISIISNHRVRIRKILYLIAAIGLLPTMMAAQVVNDNIVNRSTLILDSDAIYSSTDKATVEWQCINKALTNKCLIYHNDQWFTFEVDVSGTYYLNISSQKCRDGKGIQAIIIEGNPCETATYRILHCIPQISQYDVFIEISEVKPKVRYLVNIDGFLGDFCNFNIQLSSHPSGINRLAATLDTLDLKTNINNNAVTLHWRLPETYNRNIDAFEIHRRAKGVLRYETIGVVPAGYNALGIAQSIYEFSDTLTSENTYTYRIIGRMKDDTKEILDDHTVSFFRKSDIFTQTLDLLLDFKEGTPIQMDLIDRNEDRILRHTSFDFRKTQDHRQRIYVGEYIMMGVTNFTVRITSGKTYNVTDYKFVVMQDGSIIKL